MRALSPLQVGPVHKLRTHLGSADIGQGAGLAVRYSFMQVTNDFAPLAADALQAHEELFAHGQQCLLLRLGKPRRRLPERCQLSSASLLTTLQGRAGGSQVDPVGSASPGQLSAGRGALSLDWKMFWDCHLS